MIAQSKKIAMAQSIDLPPSRLCIGITGHREGNAAFKANRGAIETALASLLDMADQAAQTCGRAIAKNRLLSPLAQGADVMAAERALALDWQVMAPLPVGRDLNIVLNCLATDPQDTLRILDGRDGCSSEIMDHVAHMQQIAGQVRCLELAEQDALVTSLLRTSLLNPKDKTAHEALSTLCSERAAAAARVVIEQSDIVVAIWDGESPGALGGTRHTIKTALQMGVPVIWINAASPQSWTLLHAPETLMHTGASVAPTLHDAVLELFQDNLRSADTDRLASAATLHTEAWHPKSKRRYHGYRWIERRFGGHGQAFAPPKSLVQRYETPSEIASGSAAKMLADARALPGMQPWFVDQIATQILQRFAWADGLATYLSDAYRGGMVANFLLSALAIIVGISYLPLAGVDAKWPFALFELLALVAILTITQIGRRKRWHRRWFQTRRVAEYFRHAPLLLLLGVARPKGRWPQAKDSEWPEFYARETLCELGLPQVTVTGEFLRDALVNLVRVHAIEQRQYHHDKAKRLAAVHHNLDRISEALFLCAIVSVGLFLALVIAEMAHLTGPYLLAKLSKTFTFLGVVFPALGGGFAGIRYFGDFERFAAISEITAEKLTALERRIDILCAAPAGDLHYVQVTDIVRAIDEIVVAEIENWQAVFGSKQITVPV